MCRSIIRVPRFCLVLFTLLLMARTSGNANFAPPVVLTLSPSTNTADIQKALDSLPPFGEVVLGPGRYEISQPLLLRHDYETLRGSGPGTILHLANNADCPVVILGPPMTEATPLPAPSGIFPRHVEAAA